MMGDLKLHGVEQEIERSTLRVLIGFWFGIAVAAAGFLSALEISWGH